MGQYQGKRRAPGATTEIMQCAGVGPANVRLNGTAEVQLYVVEGYTEEEPGAVILNLSDDQRRMLLERLREPA